MKCVRARNDLLSAPPKMAALALAFLLLSTNMHLDAASAWNSVPPLPQPRPVLHDDQSYSDAIHVLSPKDAALYRAAFAAQEHSDWQAADTAIAQIKDKKLIGHVLADRYLRQPTELDTIKLWMADYAALPEATTLYEQAQHKHDFAVAHINHPVDANSWSGNGGIFEASAGFHDLSEFADAHKNRLSAHIDAALHHGDPIKARELLTSELQRGSLSVADAKNIVARIAASFFHEGEIERARPMAHMAGDAGVPLGLWIEGLSAWKQQDYTAASHSFVSLANAPSLSNWDRAAASYWAYRAAKKLGDKPQANHWIVEAAKYPRSFYGMMAASLTGKYEGPSWDMPELNDKNIALLSQHAEGWQALALAQIGQPDLAEAELRRLNPTGDRALQKAELALTERVQMPAASLQLAGLAVNDNGQPYDGAFYPVPRWQPADGFKIDRALLFALARHESQFDPEAISDRGACGLMQIMPATARQITNDNKSNHSCSDRLFDPSVNLQMGQKYVRVLANQPMIGDNLLLLLAAYNGGPGNLSRWLDGDERTDPLLFVESMPMRETRDYVQQVMVQYWTYRARLGQPQTSVAQLAHGEWPRYTLSDTGMRQAANQVLKLASIEAEAAAR